MVIRELIARLGLDVNTQSFTKGQLAADGIRLALEKMLEWGKRAAEKVDEIAEHGDKIEHLAQQTGLSTDELQNFARAAQMADVDTAAMAHSMQLLSRNMYAAKGGNDAAAKSFAAMGIKVTDAHGKLRSAGDVLLDMSDRFSTMPDGAEKTALALQALGRSGAQMIPVLDKGRAKLQELAALGPNLTEEQIAASREYVEVQKESAIVTQGLWQRAIAPLIPGITQLAKRFLEWKKSIAGVVASGINKFLGVAIAGVRVLGNVLDFLTRNWKGVAAIITGTVLVAVGQLEAAAVRAAISTALAWGLAAAPFVAIAAAVAALLLVYDDLRTYDLDQEKHSKTQHSLFGKFKAQWDEMYKGREKPPFLQFMIDFVESLRNAGKWLASFKRDYFELIDFLSDNMQKVAGAGEMALGLAMGDKKGFAHGAAVFSDVQRRNAPAVAHDNPFRGGFYNPSIEVPSVPPMLAPPSGAAGNVTMHVHAAPGMDEEKIADIAVRKIREHQERDNEAAADSAPND